MTYKVIFCAFAGILGGLFVQIFGAWSFALTVLVICMGIDYITGLAVAGVFHASPKSEGGGLDSNAGWKGLVRKVATLVVVLVAHFIDALIGTEYIRDAVVIAFAVNEIVSILENCAIMGVPIPKVLIKGIDVLKRRAEEDDTSSAADAAPSPQGEGFAEGHVTVYAYKEYDDNGDPVEGTRTEETE